MPVPTASSEAAVRNRENLAAALRFLQEKADLRGRFERALSLDPQEQDLADISVETGASLLPIVGQTVIGPALALRDVERARRAGDPAGMALAGTGAVPGARLAGLLKRFDPTRAEIFIGKAAKTYDPAAERRALEMEQAGVDRNTIWRETGTGRAFGPHWKQEISDAGASLRKGVDVDAATAGIPAELAMEHPELYEAYPDLRQLIIRQNQNLGSGAEAAYFPPNVKRNLPERIDLGMSVRDRPASATSAALHEMMHAIQRREGFPRGGSPEEFKVKNDLLGIDAFDQYRRLAGEAEARAVQRRKVWEANLEPESRSYWRRQSPPWRWLDVPEEDLIFRLNVPEEDLISRGPGRRAKPKR